MLAIIFARAAGGADAAEPAPTVVVSGNAAALHLTPPGGLSMLSFFSGQKEVCTGFTVRAVKDVVTTAVVTTSGLGGATFEDPAKPDIRQAARTLTGVTTAGLPLRLCLPSELVPGAGDAIEGKILVLTAGRKPVEVPLTLHRPASDPPSSAFLWFLALIIPAFLTYGIARLTAWQTERNKQLGRFAKYLDLAYPDLRDFFGVHYKTLHKDNVSDRQFASALEAAMREQRIWSRIPDRERRRLREYLRRDQRRKVCSLLASQFPDWKQDIEQPGG